MQGHHKSFERSKLNGHPRGTHLSYRRGRGCTVVLRTVQLRCSELASVSTNGVVLMTVRLSRNRLVSAQFRDDDKLQKCLTTPSAHVIPGTRGDHVSLIQGALVKLGAGVISASEISSKLYGPSTANAILRYKGPPRNIINTSYQRAPDNIVGQMTIDRLDADMVEFEKIPDNPYVWMTIEGPPEHNHTACFPLESGGHRGTPINPLPFGLKINIYGDHETDYLNFIDVAPNPEFANRKFGGPRLLTKELGPRTVGNIAVRSSPIFENHIHSNPNEVEEILRVAMPGCRITYTGTEENIRTFGPTVLKFGPLISTIEIPDLTEIEPGRFEYTPLTAYVITILDPDIARRRFLLPN